MSWIGSDPSLWLTALRVVVAFVIAVRVTVNRRPAGVSLAWLILVASFPLTGAVLYSLLGEKPLGNRRARHHQRRTKQITERFVHMWKSRGECAEPDESTKQLTHLATRVGGFPSLKNNAIELICEENQLISQLIEDIESAHSRCFLLYYIWSPQGGGIAVAEALIAAAKRGVDCRILVDHVGSWDFFGSDIEAKLRAGGVQVLAALPVNPIRMLFARVDLRNHRKIAIIDTVAYTGSQNMVDSVAEQHGPGISVDLTLRIKGPAVQALTAIFLSDWQLETEQVDRDLNDFCLKAPSELVRGDIEIQIISTGPGPMPEAMHHSFLQALFFARRTLTICTPYFVPDDATRIAILNAALRGVDISLIVPHRIDAPIVRPASQAYYQELLEAGVKIFEYPDGLMHEKSMTIDESISVVGSGNFDVRSFWLNFETTLFIYNQNFCRTLRKHQLEIRAQCKEIALNRWKKRSWRKKFNSNVARLLEPVL